METKCNEIAVIWSERERRSLTQRHSAAKPQRS